ncbi:MAG: hypothetical protein ACK5L7_11315 [Paludibacteraceae bacterium]
MNKQIWFAFIFISIPFIVVSQQTTIEGVVFDIEGKRPLSGAIVSLLDEKNEAIAYDISSDRGVYHLSFNSADKKMLLVGRMLGYKEVLVELENKSQQQNLYLEETGIEIKEVIVKSKPINVNEDTLQYSVNTFKSAGDRVIGDVLKKLPGIEVTESGGIKYKGEPINKFYIEGLDLLENKYGIATNNVPVDAVQNVEVIENHQPIKSIKGMVSSAQAAINLKLKSNKMVRPVGGIRAGSGYSDEISRLLEIFALQASRKRQSIAMYKSNNTGSDVTEEFNEQVLIVKGLQSDDNDLQKTILTPSEIGNPPIEKERYLFNNAHTASINNLWKINEDNQLRLNINYINDIRKQNTYTLSEYLLADSILRVTETDNFVQKRQSFDGVMSYTENSKGHYLDNDLKWKVKWDEDSPNSAINGGKVNQTFDMLATQIQNKLNYLKVFGKKIFNIGTLLSYTHHPENLFVKKGTEIYKQNVKHSNLYSKTGSYYSWAFGHSVFRLNGNIEASVNNINTKLSHPIFNDSTMTYRQISLINVELSPRYTYKTNRIEMEIELPMHNEIIFNKNKLPANGKTNIDNLFLINLQTGFSYKLNLYLNTQFSYRFSQNIGEYTDYIDAVLMKNYLNYYKSLGTISLKKNQSFSLSVNYKEPLKSLFVNAFVSYIPSETDRMVATRFVDLQSVKTDLNQKNRTDMWLGNVYVGKYISTIKTNFSITADYNYFQSSQIQQYILYPFSSNTLALSFKSNTKVSNQFTFAYRCNFIGNTTKINVSGTDNYSEISLYGQQIKIYYLPNKRLELNVQVEQSYNELSANSSVNMFFANIGATYKLKKVDFELYWNNIFNKREYSYSTFSELDRYSYRYGIRPMMVLGVVSFKF